MVHAVLRKRLVSSLTLIVLLLAAALAGPGGSSRSPSPGPAVVEAQDPSPPPPVWGIADLHTNQFVQYILFQYLQDNDIDLHIAKIKKAYGEQLKTMAGCIDEYFPSETSRTHPRGGMFIWAELPGGLSARQLLDRAMEEKVIFVPGDPFYVNRKDTNTMRLNFSCTGKGVIRDGIKRLGRAIETVINDM